GVLESRLQKPVELFSFPYGDGGEDPAEVGRALERAGYKAACLYDGRVNPVPPSDPYRLSRLTLGRWRDPRTELASLLRGGGGRGRGRGEGPGDGGGVSGGRWGGGGKRPKGEREEPPRAGELTSAGERSPAGGCHPADGSLFIATSGGLPAVAIPAQSRLPICRPCAG